MNAQRAIDSLHVIVSSPSSPKPVTEWLALIVAGLAVFVGPAIQLYIARRQIGATVRASNRQKWIDSLREHIAEFLTATVWLFATRHLTAGSDDSLLKWEARTEKRERLRHLEYLITLMLNPTEADHRSLIGLLDQLREHALARPEVMNKSELNTLRDQTVSLAQKIFKSEWERVKRAD